MVYSQKGISTVVVIIVIALVILAAVAGYMLFSASPQTPAPIQSKPTVTTTQQAAPSLPEVRIINVNGANFKFDPEEITVKKGERVKLVFTAGDMQHDWVVEGMGIRTKVIKAGEKTQIEFIPTEAGEFEYYCSVGNHRAQGMVGTLIVTQ